MAFKIYVRQIRNGCARQIHGHSLSYSRRSPDVSFADSVHARDRQLDIQLRSAAFARMVGFPHVFAQYFGAQRGKQAVFKHKKRR